MGEKIIWGVKTRKMTPGKQKLFDKRLNNIIDDKDLMEICPAERKRYELFRLPRIEPFQSVEYLCTYCRSTAKLASKGIQLECPCIEL